MKTSEVIGVNVALNDIFASGTKLEATLMYRLIRFQKTIAPVISAYRETLQNLVNSENRDEELKNVLDTETDIVPIQIKIEDLKGVELSGQTLNYLMPLIAD